jgi:hypothetical protein
MRENRIVFEPGVKAVRQIESFVDIICESLFINNSYYGNILMCLSDFNEILSNMGFSESVELNYFTDFTLLSLSAQLSENEIEKRHQTNNNFENCDLEFGLIRSLSDNLVIKENRILMEFNIGALHKSIYEYRLDKMNKYFQKLEKGAKV